MSSPAVVLCQPLYGVVPPLAHAHLSEFILVNTAMGCLHGYRSRVGAYIDEARNSLCSFVLDNFAPATHLLFVDQDMILPNGLLQALLADDVPVVSALYFDKSNEHLPVGWEAIDPCKRLTGYVDGLAPVAGFGMGACLIQTATLRAMSAHFGDREWFRSERGGEDLHFSRRLASLGIPFMLDSRVQCGHVADTVIAANHFHAAKERV